MRYAVLMFLLLTVLTPAVAAPPTVDDLAISVTPDHPREYIFTDKGAAHLAGEAVGPHTRSYHGFYIAMHEVVDGWALRLEDGTVLDPTTVTEAVVTPERLVRTHRLPSGETVRETVELFDRENGFRVTYDGVPSGDFAFLPRVDMRFLWRVGRPPYEVRWDNGTLLVCRQDAVHKDPDPAHPAWLAVAVRGSNRFEPDGRHVDMTYPKGAARKAMDKTSPYLPGAVMGRIPPRMPSGRVQAVFAADVSADAAGARARRLREEAGPRLGERRDRIQALIDSSGITTGVARDDLALAWARVSLDNLIMNQRGWGIYAGFYWFTTYWGRDTFITLPGACIVSGQFEMAETLLRAFAEFQETDMTNPRAGRVPNFVTVDQVQYASIDGTWWFVRALDELWRQAGNDAFVAEMAPIVFRAVEGALQHAVDDQGFLVHGDGETWMDGGGEEHPYSPRGNRGVEIQALWHRGLLSASRMADAFEDPERGDRYARLAVKLAGNFHAEFWDGDRLIDHLNTDGSQDHQIRPNGLLAVMSSPTLFTAEQRDQVTRLAAEKVVRPWGVISLTEDDPFFHPRHLDLGNYYYDEAYHNGDLWLWLSGGYVSALNDPRDGFGQTRMLLDEIMDEGAVGTLQEIRDGAQAATNDEFGGATSQAWSLAELLRNVVQDYAGLRVDFTAAEPSVRVQPRVPAEWPGLDVHTRIGTVAAHLTVTTADAFACEVRLAGEPDARLTWTLVAPDGDTRSGRVQADTAEAAWPWRVVWE